MVREHLLYLHNLLRNSSNFFDVVDTGGAKIEKYILQKKDKFKPEWENAGEVPGDQLTGKIKDLKERGEYQFRIIAVNKAGPGGKYKKIKNQKEPTQVQ